MKTTLNQRFLRIRGESQKCMGAGGAQRHRSCAKRAVARFAQGRRARSARLRASPGYPATRRGCGGGSPCSRRRSRRGSAPRAARRGRRDRTPLPMPPRAAGRGYAVSPAGGRRSRPSASRLAQPAAARSARGGWRAERATCGRGARQARSASPSHPSSAGREGAGLAASRQPSARLRRAG